MQKHVQLLSTLFIFSICMYVDRKANGNCKDNGNLQMYTVEALLTDTHKGQHCSNPVFVYSLGIIHIFVCKIEYFFHTFFPFSRLKMYM